MTTDGTAHAQSRVFTHRGALITGAVFVLAGLNHFVMPGFYERIVPSWLTADPFPSALMLVAASGVAEVAGGVGLMVPGKLRRAAAWGLIAMLIAVFPANIEMALHPEGAGANVPVWTAWARLPLQGVFVWWVWFVGLRSRACSDSTSPPAIADNTP